MTNQSLVIFGTSSLAKQAYYFASREMGLNPRGFIVDAYEKKLDLFCGLPVLCWESFLELHDEFSTSVYLAIGYKKMRNRRILFDRIKSAGYTMINLVSTSAYVAETVQMGENNFVMPGVVIEPEVLIGENNVFWSNSTVCHDTIIGHHNFFASNCTIGGNVRIGDCCFFGFSSTVLQDRFIENDVLLASHSMMLNDGQTLGHYRGLPAKRFKNLSSSIGVCVQ